MYSAGAEPIADKSGAAQAPAWSFGGPHRAASRRICHPVLTLAVCKPKSFGSIHPSPEGWRSCRAPEAASGCRTRFHLSVCKGVQSLVSLITDGEAYELKLEGEEQACEAAGMEYFRLPIEDRSTPESHHDTEELLDALRLRLQEGKGVAIHCRMGLGRSAMIAAKLLTQAGVAPRDAFQRISTARGLETPDTKEQFRWASEA